MWLSVGGDLVADSVTVLAENEVYDLYCFLKDNTFYYILATKGSSYIARVPYSYRPENVTGFLENREVKQVLANVINPIDQAARDANERGKDEVEGLFAQAQPVSTDKGPLPMPAKEAARAGLNLLPAL